MRRWTTLGALCALSAVTAAEPVTLVNSSFEDASHGAGGFDLLAPNGWSGIENTLGTFHPTIDTYGYEATDGDHVLFTNGGTATQVTGEVLEAGVTYELTVDIIARPGLFDGYAVRLLAGGRTIAEDASSLTPVVGGSVTTVVTYTATADDALLGRSVAISLWGPFQANFDNVRLTAVPAPGVVCSFGVLGLAASRRRR
ncbi:MAG: hypothetical protein AAGI53_16030 [Planctomycetota bacterium]